MKMHAPDAEFACCCRLASGNIGDLWMPCLVFICLLASFIQGLIKLISSENPQNTLMISLVWVVYNMIPPFLLLWYTWVGQGTTLRVRLAAARFRAVLVLILPLLP